MTETELLEHITASIQGGKTLALITDFDSTIAEAGDPLNITINQKCASALRSLSIQGVHIGIISARTAKKVTTLTSSISPNSIVGTSGWETYAAGAKNSIIHSRFLPYASAITNILKTTREDIYKYINVHSNVSKETEIPIETPHGRIVLEMKGVTEGYSEGIVHTYNFNAIEPKERTRYLEILKGSYHKAFSTVLHQVPNAAPSELKKLCQLHTTNAKPEDMGDFSLHISPDISHGKAFAIRQYISTVPERDEYFKGIPGTWDLVLYFGDTDEDGYAFAEGKKTAAERLQGQQFFGIWVQGPHSHPIAEKEASVIVQGVAGNARLLQAIAAKVLSIKY